MPYNESELATRIAGRFTSGTDQWGGQELEDQLLEMNENLLNKQDYSPSGVGTAHPAIAYVTSNGNDTTGTVGDIGKPYLTVDAALDDMSALAYRVIIVGPGTFQSPTRAKILSGTRIIGSGKPVANFSATGGAYPSISLGTPTKLIGGTIFQNTFWVPYNVSDITLGNFGVDCGSDWCTASNGGTAVDALLIPANNGTTNPTLNGGTLRTNINVFNVSAICKSASDSVHACLIERCLEPVARNIDTWFGFAGFVSKNVGGQFNNIKAHNHGTFSIVIKQNSYGYSYNSILDGFEIRGGNGLCLEDGDGSGGLGMVGITCTNGKIIGTGNGVFQNGTLLDWCNLSNIDVIGTTSGNGFNLTGITNSTLLNCTVDGSAGSGFVVTGGNVSVSHCRARSTGSNGFNLNGTSANQRMVAIGNNCYGETFVAGTHVYGSGNHYTSLSGTINAF